MKAYFKTVLRKYKAAIKFAETHRKPEVMEYLRKRQMHTGLCRLVGYDDPNLSFARSVIMIDYQRSTGQSIIGFWWPVSDHVHCNGELGQKRTRDIISKCLKPRVKFLEDLIKTL